MQTRRLRRRLRRNEATATLDEEVPVLSPLPSGWTPIGFAAASLPHRPFCCYLCVVPAFRGTGARHLSQYQQLSSPTTPLGLAKSGLVARLPARVQGPSTVRDLQDAVADLFAQNELGVFAYAHQHFVKFELAGGGGAHHSPFAQQVDGAKAGRRIQELKP
jgi:hypothetical protein